MALVLGRRRERRGLTERADGGPVLRNGMERQAEKENKNSHESPLAGSSTREKPEKTGLEHRHSFSGLDLSSFLRKRADDIPGERHPQEVAKEKVIDSGDEHGQESLAEL